MAYALPLCKAVAFDIWQSWQTLLDYPWGLNPFVMLNSCVPFQVKHRTKSLVFIFNFIMHKTAYVTIYKTANAFRSCNVYNVEDKFLTIEN